MSLTQRSFNPYLGTDPEFFFVDKSGKVIPAEKILGKSGIKNERENFDGSKYSIGKLVPDGVQLEINLSPDQKGTCRQTFWSQLERAYTHMLKIADDNNVLIDTEQVKKFTQEEIDAFPDSCKRFGCAPSYNVYSQEVDKVSVIPVNPAEYLYRSAGGHMHFGIPKEYLTKMGVDNLVRLLDIFVGNTLVLFDRHPLMAERRKVYGRAGEYRLPSYGLEYRTPSNYWCRDYLMMSMSYGLARTAMWIAENPELRSGLLNLVSDKEVQMSINLNDFDLALQVFEKVKAFMSQIESSNSNTDTWFTDYSYNCVFYSKRINKFLDFIRKYPGAPSDIRQALKTKGTVSGFESYLDNLK
jgi:hypothetical protein